MDDGLTCETVRDVENAFRSPATQQNADYTFLVTDFSHAVEVVDHAEEDQGVHHHFAGGYFLARHFELCTEFVFFSRLLDQRMTTNFGGACAEGYCQSVMIIAFINIKIGLFSFKLYINEFNGLIDVYVCVKL